MPALRPLFTSCAVIGALSVLAACPKDEMGTVAEQRVKPDASTANVIKIVTTVPVGTKVACAKIIDPLKIAPMIGEAEVAMSDTTGGSEREATSVCSIRKTGKTLSEKEQAKLQEQTGFKLGVQPGDEICQLRAYCSFPYDIAETKKTLEGRGQFCSTEIGDLTCVDKVQAGADYRYIVTVMDPDAQCRYVISPTTITEEAPMKACAKAFVDVITKEGFTQP